MSGLAASLAAGLVLLGDVLVRPPPPLPEGAAAWRAALREGRPALRGFRAPVLERREETAPTDLPEDEVLRRAAVLVSRQLAGKGLLATTVDAAAILSGSGRKVDEASLVAVGIPVDWLARFRRPGAAAGTGPSALERVISAAGTGEPLEELTSFALDFRASVGGFELATESGEHEIGLVRMQLTRGTFWSGEGDGGSVDLARQLLEALPNAEFVLVVEAAHLEDLLRTVRSWRLERPERVTVVPERLPVSQWAQDDGKAGLAPAVGPSADRSRREVVTLVPRYASRGEEGGLFVPGETFALEGFSALGNRVVQSPLLFQGGDLLAVRYPATGERLLLLGEANVWRNTALGLTEAQVLEAFRIEFGVDHCAVLPAVSFHLDQEVSVRAVGERLVAFVADPEAAVRSLLEIGVGRLESAGVLEDHAARRARETLAAEDDRAFLSIVEPALGSACETFGHFPSWLAEHFSEGEADSGVGNLQRFLLAVDHLASEALPLDEISRDPHSIAYLRSLRRREEDRRSLAAALREAGFEVRPIPSLPETTRGIDYLNGVQEPARYLMPAWGGVYSPLDRAAAEAFRAAAGKPLKIQPILSSESQRRGGAIHCSLSVLPRP